MALHLNDKWVWDFWFAHKGAETHIFYLQAPRSLKNPDLRHWHSSIGHASSKDLLHWDILPDALHPSDEESAWDSFTTWTGSIIHYNQLWYLFYTGTSKADHGWNQQIGIATSVDLIHWKKSDANPIIRSNPKWYELPERKIWYEQTWRDPWVFERNGIFHALITARSKTCHPDGRGVIGHACSKDLLHWEVQEPITQPGEFAYMEVPQLIKINHHWYLLFSVEGDRYSKDRLARIGSEKNTGTHYMIADDPFGPFVQPKNDLLIGDKLGSTYSGKIIQNNAGNWMLLTVIQYNQSKIFVGDISDPMPLMIEDNGQISVSIQQNRKNSKEGKDKL